VRGALASGQWAVGSGQWAVDNGLSVDQWICRLWAKAGYCTLVSSGHLVRWAWPTRT
jgi:hypothetical protein